MRLIIFVRFVPIIGLCCPGPSPVLGGTLSRVCALSFSPFHRYSSNPYFDNFLKNIFQEYLGKDILEKKIFKSLCGNFWLASLFHLHTLNKRMWRKKATKKFAEKYHHILSWEVSTNKVYNQTFNKKKVFAARRNFWLESLERGHLGDKYMGTVQTYVK